MEEVWIDQLQMKEQGVVFDVRRVEADYIAPALMGDRLTGLVKLFQQNLRARL